MNNLPRAILFGVLVTAAVAFGVYRWSVDPMNSRGLGRGWECSVLGKGAVACDQDASPLPTKPKPPLSKAAGIAIAVDRNGAIFWNGTKISCPELNARMQAIYQAVKTPYHKVPCDQFSETRTPRRTN